MMSCRSGVCACRRQSCGRVRPDGTPLYVPSLGRRHPQILGIGARARWEQNHDSMSFCLVASSREERRCCLLSFTRRPRSLPAARTIGKVPERRRPHGHEYHQVPGPTRARAPVRASRARAARPDLPRRGAAGRGGPHLRRDAGQASRRVHLPQAAAAAPRAEGPRARPATGALQCRKQNRMMNGEELTCAESKTG